MAPNYMILIQKKEKKTKNKEEEGDWPETRVNYGAAKSFSFSGGENFPL